MKHHRVAVVDFGGQYAHLVANKIRRLHVLAEILNPEASISAFAAYQGLILSGSPALFSHGDKGGVDPRVFDLDIPILGLCFGHQQMAKHYGGVIEHTAREYGPANLQASTDSPIFFNLPSSQVVWMSHGDSVTELPKHFCEIGASINPDGTRHANAAMASDELKRYGFQFHPEVDDTEHGEAMLRNFVINVCGCKPSWTMNHYVQGQVEAIRREVGDKGVFLLVSGGVDSTVCASLLGKALGSDKLHLLHVDHGMMRKNESECVIAELTRLDLAKNLHFVDASDQFIKALNGVIEPEEKRKVIGNTFLEVFEKEAKRHQLSDLLLGQGTIYPDTVETGGTKRADTIKTHHNRVPLIQERIAQGKVIEPLKDLYKVEVRELGEELGIDASLIWRHPFPGPGLGVRVLCSDGLSPVGHNPDAVQPILDRLTKPLGLSALLLPAKSVGVKADVRVYEQPVLLWGKADFDALTRVATQIFQRVPGVNRCVFDLTGKGANWATPITATITRARLDLLREADDIVMRALKKHGLMKSVWQCPIVLLPLCINGHGKELVIIRPVQSERAMTARPAPLPNRVVDEIRAPILALPEVSALVIDVTTKPPGTIEWE